MLDFTNFFKGKKVTVFGLGVHGGGLAITKFLAKYGAKVIVTDIKTKEQLASSLEKLKDVKNVEYVLGQHRPEDFTNADMIIKTPGVSWDNKYLKLAAEKNIPVEMDSGLFFRFCKNPIIGVTGTKGKTTTATIIYEILKSAGKNPVKAGIGQVAVLDKLELLKKESVVVFELSSWRLSALAKEKKSPQIAVVKNILPDHLNYYKTMESYIADKKNIFLFQKQNDYLIINEDDEIVKKFAGESKSQIIKFSYSPIRDGKSVYVEEEAIYINNGNDCKKLIDIKDLKMRGLHNVSNMLAGIAAVFAYGVEITEIKKAVLEFKGVPHRLEFVKEIRNVKYYNDTTATIPDAAISAVNSFSEPVILIAGGTDKNLDFKNFIPNIEKVKKIILLKGTATDKILEEAKKIGSEKIINSGVVDSMEKAVWEASQDAKAEDVVLLSPGAASFGLFANEFERGDKFKEAVSKLK
jgi:UDP-N-acetylmuramoylalanine--D-glutamate ligase